MTGYDHGANPDYAIIIAELHKRLGSTLAVLHAHVDAHGMISGREDETFAFGRLALRTAEDAGLIDVATGRMPETLAVLPVDDETRSFSDPILPEALVSAGEDVLDAVARDMAAYVSGETVDWDNGMAAVAVYRAMTRRMRERSYACRLSIDDRSIATIVGSVSLDAAARDFALATFHAWKGEWMGGRISVTEAPAEDAEGIAAHLTMFGTAYDATIDFDQERDGETIAIVSRIAG